MIRYLAAKSSELIENCAKDIILKQEEQYKKDLLDNISSRTVNIFRSKKKLEPEESLSRRKLDQAVSLMSLSLTNNSYICLIFFF